MRHRPLAALIGMSVVLGACGASATATPAASAPAAAVASGSAGSAAAATATAGSAAAPSSDVPLTNAGPLGASIGSDPGKAGTYQTRQAKPTFRFTVPAGWNAGQLLQTFVGADESASGIALNNGAGVVVVSAPTSIYPTGPGDPGSPVPADLLATLAKDPKLDLGPTSPITIGGLAGQQLEGTVKADAQTGQDVGYRISDYLLAKPGDHVRFAQVQVGTTPVVVMSTAAPDSWASFASGADALIDSIAFVP